MAAKAKATARQGVRRDRNLKEHRHDSYRLFGKLKEPTVCSGCGALFHKGRWTWGAAPKGAATTTCPACHRMHDKYPMGLVTIAGSFKEKQHEQVVGVIHNAAAQEKKEAPAVTAGKALKLSGSTQFQAAYWKDAVDSFAVRRARFT